MPPFRVRCIDATAAEDCLALGREYEVWSASVEYVPSRLYDTKLKVIWFELSGVVSRWDSKRFKPVIRVKGWRREL